MSSTEISKFRNILGGRAAELGVATRRRDVIAIEQSAEELERGVLASEREVAMQNLEGESVKLREVRAAPYRRGHLWDLLGVSGTNQSKTPGRGSHRCPMHSLPGGV